METNPVKRAIEAAGGAKSVADRLGLTYEAVRLWVEAGMVPAKRVLALESMSGVSRHELNPDIYGDGVPAVAPKRQRSARTARA